MLKSRPKTVGGRVCFRIFWTTLLGFWLLFGGQVWGQPRSKGVAPEQTEQMPKRKVAPPITDQPIHDWRETLSPAKSEREEASQETGAITFSNSKDKLNKRPKTASVKPHIITHDQNKKKIPAPAAESEAKRSTFNPPLYTTPMVRNFQSQEDRNLINQVEEYSLEDDEDDYYSQAKLRHKTKGLKGRFFEDQSSTKDDLPSEDNVSKGRFFQSPISKKDDLLSDD